MFRTLLTSLRISTYNLNTTVSVRIILYNILRSIIMEGRYSVKDCFLKIVHLLEYYNIIQIYCE